MTWQSLAVRLLRRHMAAELPADGKEAGCRDLGLARRRAVSVLERDLHAARAHGPLHALCDGAGEHCYMHTCSPCMHLLAFLVFQVLVALRACPTS